MSQKPIFIPCREPFLRHRWERVRGSMATADHEYVERRCKRCGEYESEVRCPHHPVAATEWALDLERLARGLGQTTVGERGDGTPYDARTLSWMAQDIAYEYEKAREASRE